MSLPESLKARMTQQLHQDPRHPVGIVDRMIQAAMADFKAFEDLPAVVTLEQNFDWLRIPKDHPSRSRGDTYYVDEGHVYRTHTSAHQVDLLRAGFRKFLVAGQVYRRDEIDASHYPIFHQMEGVSVAPHADGDPLEDLRGTLGRIVEALFPSAKWRMQPDYFPFTEPSYEVVVEWNGKDLEVAGCGVVHPEVLSNAGLDPTKHRGWAFGLGLDRLAMILFGIPDIRLLWSRDERFLGQFQDGKVVQFRPFSTQPPCYKDIAFWVPAGYEKNDFFELVRCEGGDLVEEVREIDTFEKGGRVSKCYRILYRSMERTLENQEVDAIQARIRRGANDRLKVELR